MRNNIFHASIAEILQTTSTWKNSSFAKIPQRIRTLNMWEHLASVRAPANILDERAADLAYHYAADHCANVCGKRISD